MAERGGSMKRTSCVLVAAVCAVALVCIAAAYLREKEDVIPSGTLGMALIDIMDEDAAASYHVEELGIYVLAVEQQSQAERAGIRSGDRLVRVNGQPVANTGEFASVQERFEPMQTIRLDFQRGYEANPLSAQLVWENGEDQ